MHLPMVCPSCGYPIGELEEIFDMMKQDYMKEMMEKHNSTAKNLCMVTGVDVEFGPILDKLCVDNLCCRMRFPTNLAWKDYS